MKKLLYWCIILILVEGCSLLGCLYLSYKAKVLYCIKPDKQKYAEYLQLADSVLGWPLRHKDSNTDISGARLLPAYPNPQKSQSCISLYGDSFTKGSHVDNEHCWANVLASLLQCRVSNFGVGGYGTDQAFLRYKLKKNDSSDIVILNHQSENIIRNVNQYRDLIYNMQGFGFKPRFLAEEKGLTLISKPSIPFEEYETFCNSPAKYLSHEYFLPGGASGIQEIVFPFTLSLLRSFNHFRVVAKFRGKPGHFDFYRKDHPSNALNITKLIMKEFTVEAKKRHQQPIITILPNCRDLEYYIRHHKWGYQALIDEFKSENIDVVNIGPLMIAKIKDRDVGDFFFSADGHYNEVGNKIVAEIFYEHLNHEAMKSN